MRKLSKFLIASIIMFAPLEVSAFEFSFGKKFLNYGNGAINLALVAHISPKWDYIYTTPGDSVDDILKMYGEVPFKRTIKERVKTLFNAKEFEKMEWYYIENNALINFDGFKLTILEGEVFFKMPDCSLLASIVSKNPKFSTFLKKSAEAFEIEINQNACMRLQKKQNKLTEDAIEKIQEGLVDTANIYSKIADR
jgi:hypothetical protein